MNEWTIDIVHMPFVSFHLHVKRFALGALLYIYVHVIALRTGGIPWDASLWAAVYCFETVLQNSISLAQSNLLHSVILLRSGLL